MKPPCLDEYTKSNHRWKSCKRGGGNFQKRGRWRGIRQNHKGKKCGFDRVLTLFLHFWAEAKTAVFLYMVHNIISPVIKFYKELSTLSTKFSTPFKGAWIKGFHHFHKIFHKSANPIDSLFTHDEFCWHNNYFLSFGRMVHLNEQVTRNKEQGFVRGWGTGGAEMNDE